MRFYHCADVHLDSPCTSNLSAEMAASRRAELLATFARMVEQANREHVDGILIAGDLFDMENVSRTTAGVVRDMIVRYSNLDFYYLSGNHDSDVLLGVMDYIPDNLKLFNNEWTSYRIEDGGRHSVIITGMDLDGRSNGVSGDELALDRDNINILMLHGQIVNGTNRQPEDINIRSFADKGIDYMALGHIHSYRAEEIDKRGIYCYSGCLEGRGFDEAGEHGYVELNIDTMTGTVNYELIPFAFRTINRIDVDISECNTSSQVIATADSMLDNMALDENSIIELVLTGIVSEAAEISTEYITRYYERRFYMVRVKSVTKLAVDYGQYIMDTSLRGEFVRLVQGDESLTEEEKAKIIAFGLQALDS